MIPRAGNKVRKFVKCPVCGANRAPWTIRAHIRRRHPGVDLSRDAREVTAPDRVAAETQSPDPSGELSTDATSLL